MSAQLKNTVYILVLCCENITDVMSSTLAAEIRKILQITKWRQKWTVSKHLSVLRMKNKFRMYKHNKRIVGAEHFDLTEFWRLKIIKKFFSSFIVCLLCSPLLL